MNNPTNSPLKISGPATITPARISVQQFVAWKNQATKPIDGINISNITFPPGLASKKRPTETSDTLITMIRQLFNSLTEENIAKVKTQLREIVYAKAQNVQALEDIANEILQNFVISEQNIKNYMQLLNSIWNASVLIPTATAEKTVSRTIGNYFLSKCHKQFLEWINEDNIRRLAKMDTDDLDQLDIYNRERDKIINLIITICYLYEQRNKALIKLTALHLYPVIKIILDTHQDIQKRMLVLGDPMEGQCHDENEYEILRKMCSIYAEQLYTFISREKEEFLNDQTEIIDKSTTSPQHIDVLVKRFIVEIIPTLTEAYLISKCEKL